MAKGARNRAVRTAEPPRKVRWADVHALLDVELQDEDFILDRYLYDPDEEDGAPESVYRDLKLLRAWLEVHHPLAVCDGPDCQKRHLHPDYPCNGTHVQAQAINRTLSAVIGRMRDLDPKAPVTSVRVLEFLQKRESDGSR